MANNVKAFIPEIYSQKLLRESKEISDFKNNHCNNDWEGEIKNFGDTVRISTPNAEAVTIGTGVVPATSDVIPTQITMTIDKTRNFQFKFNDVEQAQSQFNLVEGYMSIGNQKMLDEVNLELEQHVVDQALAGNIPEVGTPAAPIATTFDDVNNVFNRIKRVLTQNKALSAAGFYTFKGNKEQALQLAPIVTISPALFEELVNSTVLTHPTVQGDDILYKGVVGQIAGMKIFVDTLLDTIKNEDGTFSADEAQRSYVAIAGTKMGITFAEQYNKVEKLRDPQTFADIGRALYLYGFKITNPKSLVKGQVKVA
jgi:hypothetical protein